MNREEVKRLDRVEIAVKDNTKQLEKIITNDLPHVSRLLGKVKETADRNSGKLWAVGIVMAVILALVIGLYFT